MKKEPKEPEMMDEYDFSRGVQGKYTKRYAEGTNVVVVDADVAPFFPDHDSVNDALRHLAAVIKNREQSDQSPQSEG